MIELEVKAVVSNAIDLISRMRTADAHEEFVGHMSDRRLDFADQSLSKRDEVLRVRTYRDSKGTVSASVDWKGPVSFEGGYKRREEIASEADPEHIMAILNKLGLRVVHAIDRDIRQWTLDGATVRLEHYPQMDDLVEVEGDTAAIERAIGVLGIPRAEFSSDSLAMFADRYVARTGRPAILGVMDATDPPRS